MRDNSLRERSLADLAKSKVWTDNLKPRLEEIKKELQESEDVPDEINEAAIRDIRRSVTNKVINRVIRIVERAETRVKINDKS